MKTKKLKQSAKTKEQFGNEKVISFVYNYNSLLEHANFTVFALGNIKKKDLKFWQKELLESAYEALGDSFNDVSV